MVSIEKADKCLDGCCLAHHVSRGTDEHAQLVLMNRPQTVEVHHATFDQVDDGALYGAPGSVLGQVSADDDLQRRLRRPPLLRAIRSGQLVVKIAQNGPGCFGHGFGFCCCKCFFQPNSLAFSASASASAIMPLC